MIRDQVADHDGWQPWVEISARGSNKVMFQVENQVWDMLPVYVKARAVKDLKDKFK